MNFSDEQLMLLFAQGQSSAFDELYYRYDRRLLNFVARMTGWQRADVEDMVQEIFVRVARSASKYQPSAKFSTWLHRVATNSCLNNIKKRKSHPYLRVITGGMESQQSAGTSCDPLRQMIEHEGDGALQSALSKLSLEQKTVFLLRQVQGLSYSEISQIVNLPLGTVKTNIYRARTSMVRALGSFLQPCEEISTNKDSGLNRKSPVKEQKQ